MSTLDERNELLLRLYELLEDDFYNLEPGYITLKKEIDHTKYHADNSTIHFRIVGDVEGEMKNKYLVSIKKYE